MLNLIIMFDGNYLFGLTRDGLTNATEINILIIKALILIMNTCTKYDCYHFNNYFTKHHNLSMAYYDEASVYIL